MPGQALRGLAADGLMQRIVFILRDGDADLDIPVAIPDVSGDFGFRIPAEPLAARCTAIEIDDGAGGTDGDAVVGVRFGGDLDLHGIAIPDRLVAVFGGGVVGLLAGVLIAADGKADAVSLPTRFVARAEDGLATGLQFAELARSGNGAFLPIRVVESPTSRTAGSGPRF